MSASNARLRAVNSHLASPKHQSYGFQRLIRFVNKDNENYFYDLGVNEEIPARGQEFEAYPSFDSLLSRKHGRTVIFERLLAPLPYETKQPIYCVGVNYSTHAKEANLDIPADPMLWLKPSAALAAHGEEIYINEFCAESFLDYEGELVFVTGQACRDVSPEEAEGYILGLSIGNDLSCRMHQRVEQGGGQFVFAKGFDQFGPIGPILVNYQSIIKENIHMTTKVNGNTVQSAQCFEEFIWQPAQVLSHMSQGTTIPAGTAVMTGTPSGVGVFCNPIRALQDNDIIEIAVTSIGTLTNKIVYK